MFGAHAFLARILEVVGAVPGEVPEREERAPRVRALARAQRLLLAQLLKELREPPRDLQSAARDVRALEVPARGLRDGADAPRRVREHALVHPAEQEKPQIALDVRRRRRRQRARLRNRRVDDGDATLQTERVRGRVLAALDVRLERGGEEERVRVRDAQRRVDGAECVQPEREPSRARVPEFLQVRALPVVVHRRRAVLLVGSLAPIAALEHFLLLFAPQHAVQHRPAHFPGERGGVFELSRAAVASRGSLGRREVFLRRERDPAQDGDDRERR